MMASSRGSPKVDFVAGSCGAAVENRNPFQPLPNPTTNLQGDEVLPLSAERYYDVVLSKSHLHPRYQMGLLNNLDLILPSAEVPTVLNYLGKSWDMMYKGHCKGHKWFDSGGWRKFANDNCLKLGDACIFELMEYSKEKIIFRVQILRGDIPSKFHEIIMGESADVPIVID